MFFLKNSLEMAKKFLNVPYSEKFDYWKQMKWFPIRFWNGNRMQFLNPFIEFYTLTIFQWLLMGIEDWAEGE